MPGVFIDSTPDVQTATINPAPPLAPKPHVSTPPRRWGQWQYKGIGARVDSQRGRSAKPAWNTPRDETGTRGGAAEAMTGRAVFSLPVVGSIEAVQDLRGRGPRGAPPLRAAPGRPLQPVAVQADPRLAGVPIELRDRTPGPDSPWPGKWGRDTTTPPWSAGL